MTTGMDPYGTHEVSALRRLFAGAQRWGWEYRHAVPAASPFRRPPVLRLPEPSWAARLAPAFEQFLYARRVWLTISFLCACVAVATALHGAQWNTQLLHYSASQPGRTPVNYHLGAWPPYFAAAAIIGLVGVTVRQITLRARLERSLRGWMRATALAHEAYYQELAGWEHAREDHLAGEQASFADQPRWYPIRPEVLRRLDVFGGSAAGWEMLLVTAGCSLLGAGGRVSVVDLSQQDVARELIQAAMASGRPCGEITLPAQSAVTDIFAGLDAVAVADVLTETVHGSDDKPDQAARGVDARVLGAVCEALGDSLSIERICAGLRVLLRQEQPPDEGSPLSASEYDRISGLFGETFRRSTEARVTALEALLHPLAPVGREISRSLALYSADARLQVTRIAEDAGALAAALTAQLVLQLLLNRMRAGGDPGTGDRTLVVAGADSLPGTFLDQLGQLARRRDIRLVLMFAHLRDGAEQLLGGADTVFVMRLGNTAEAARAAEFIGREHRFVVHQFTMTETSGTSDTVNRSLTTSLQRGSTSGLGGGSRSVSASESVSGGSSQGESSSLAAAGGRQRVYEFAVEPVALQSLPESMFVFIDSSRRHGPRARVGDCDPRLLLQAGTCDEPAGARDRVR